MIAADIKEKKNYKIVVALSGGIDSGMSVLRLKEQGWGAIFAANHVVCRGVKSSSVEVLGRASALCERENIPFYIINGVDKFNDIVIDDFEEAYIKGKTPNPCVICNEHIKFTWFYDNIRSKLIDEKKLVTDEMLYFATGHYARLAEKDGKIFIRKAADKIKDQSYMLYRLPPEILPRLVFPLGDTYKKELTEEASGLGLAFDCVKESQDICFIEGDYGDFLIKSNPKLVSRIGEGSIINMEGKKLGKHKGYIFYTIGQRKGLSLGNGPWYVTGIDPASNTVVVGREDQQGQTEFCIKNNNWFIDIPEDSEILCSVMVRYNSSEELCRVTFKRGENPKVELKQKKVITPGQSAVFYQDDIVIGGGVICSMDAASCSATGMSR